MRIYQSNTPLLILLLALSTTASMMMVPAKTGCDTNTCESALPHTPLRMLHEPMEHYSTYFGFDIPKTLLTCTCKFVFDLMKLTVCSVFSFLFSFLLQVGKLLVDFFDDMEDLDAQYLSEFGKH